MRAGGDSEGNPFPEVLDLTTPLLLHFLFFLIFSTAERPLSNKKSKDCGGADLLSIPTLKLPPFYPGLGTPGTQHPGHSTQDTAPQDTALLHPSSSASGLAACPFWGGPQELLHGNLWGDAVAKGGSGEQPALPCRVIGDSPSGDPG